MHPNKITGVCGKKRRIASIYRDLLSGLDGVYISWGQSGSKVLFGCPFLGGYQRKIRIKFHKIHGSHGISVKIFGSTSQQKAFEDYTSDKIDANKLFGSSVCLPCSTEIREDDQVVVVDKIKMFLKIIMIVDLGMWTTQSK